MTKTRDGGAARRPPAHKWPLRRVVASLNQYEELLDCDHVVLRRVDNIGPTNAYRRRCWRCYDAMLAERERKGGEG